MTKRTQWNLIAAVLLVLGLAAVLVPLLMALPWVLFPLRDAERLKYPDRVTFTRTDGDYTRAAWDAGDWDKPGPCPVTVHLAGQDLDPADLGSFDRLRRLGWVEQVYENSDGRVTGTAMRSPNGVVECSYRGGQMTNVTVDAAKANGPGEVAISLGGRRIALPNSADAITSALGPPLAKD